MTGKRVTTTLEEDLQALGISGMAGGNVGGIMGLTESDGGVMPSLGASVHDVQPLFENDGRQDAVEEWMEVLGDDFDEILAEAKKAKKKGKKMSSFVKDLAKRKDIKDPEALAGWLAHYNPPNWEDVDEDGEEIDEDHPIDGRYVTVDLLERVKALPFDSMDEDMFTDVIEHLKEKSFRDDADDDLKELAEEVALMLVEGRRRKRVRKAMSRGKQTKMVCGEGKHWDESKKACVVAGGKYKAKRRKKQRKASRGPQKMKRERSQRKVKRMGLSASDQTFADKLESLISEDFEAEEREYTVREEIVERIDRSFALFAEEFNDERIDDVFLAVMEDVDEKADAGLLAEDEADDEQFLVAIAPALKLVRECYQRVVSEDEGGDDDDDDWGDGAEDGDPLARLRGL